MHTLVLGDLYYALRKNLRLSLPHNPFHFTLCFANYFGALLLSTSHKLRYKQNNN